MVEIINFQESDESKTTNRKDVVQDDYYVFNKGTKVGKNEERDYQHFKMDDTLDDVTNQNSREYMYFKVKNTPYIDDLN